MKKLKSYKLHPDTIKLIDLLAAKTGWTATKVIEEAVKRVAKERKVEVPEV